MLAKTRLQASALDQEQRRQFSRLVQDFDALRTRWPVAWEGKCLRSFRFRLVQWRDYLEEYRKAPEDCAHQYPYEVRWRVIIELLKGDICKLEEADSGLLAGLDALLRSFLEPGGFVWDKSIAMGFSAEQYWFLYGSLPVRRSG